MQKLVCVFLLAVLCGNAPADVTVIDNVIGYTPTDAGSRSFGALAFDDNGRIVALDPEPGAFPDAIVIDGAGRHMLPGITDAHAHLAALGFLQVQLDLFGVDSLAEVLRRIGEYANASQGSGWIEGRGWNQVLWVENEFPTAADIDSVVADRPVWLRRVDGHAGWANTKALELAGIDQQTEDPVGGKIIRDENGHATGVLIDKAMDLVRSKVPKPGKPELRAAYQAAFETVNRLGVTGVHDAGVPLKELEVLMSLAEDGDMSLRVYAMIAGAGANLDAIGEPITGIGDDRLDIRSVKLFQDGALGSRGAALIEPYSDDPENRGLPFWTQKELNEKVEKSNRLGFQVGIHAIGDRGNRMALDAFEAVQSGDPSPLRNRIEHSQIIALSDIPRFAELGVIASIQPTHATSDMNMAEDRVGPARIKGGYAWRRMLEAGVVLAGGSDFPVELVNPFHGLYAAVTRKDRQGMPEGGWYAEEALSRAEALHSFTLGAAYAAHQEHRLGSLEPGKWADFIIVDRDYFEIDDGEIDEIEVLETWVGGRKVYDYKEAM